MITRGEDLFPPLAVIVYWVRLESIDKAYEHHQVIFSQLSHPFHRNMNELRVSSFRIEKL